MQKHWRNEQVGACLQGLRIVDVAARHHLVPAHALLRLRQLFCLQAKHALMRGRALQGTQSIKLYVLQAGFVYLSTLIGAVCQPHWWQGNASGRDRVRQSGKSA
jgi:hypothetical protein